MRRIGSIVFAFALVFGGIVAWFFLAFQPAHDRVFAAIQQVEVKGSEGPFALYELSDGSHKLLGRDIAPPENAKQVKSFWVKKSGRVKVTNSPGCAGLVGKTIWGGTGGGSWVVYTSFNSGDMSFDHKRGTCSDE